MKVKIHLKHSDKSFIHEEDDMDSFEGWGLLMKSSPDSPIAVNNCLFMVSEISYIEDLSKPE